jgi:tetratricopeptide (TPR) repeat protein
MSMVLADLGNVAFGDDPGRWPLPQASTPHELWLRAVAAGGQGRYGSAMADLADVCRLARGGPQVSLAHSTRASFLRQLGWHDRARRWDGRAMALAGSDQEACADALIGLAAYALWVGRFAASAMALRRAGEVLATPAPPRLPVRLAWVFAELAMARGDGATAVGHAERAVELAAAFGSARHAVKSDVILAAALSSAGDIDASRRVADAALQATELQGMIPLRWALACLLADIGSAGHTAADVLRIRNECAATVRRRGGHLADR